MTVSTKIQRVVFPEDGHAASLYLRAEASDGSARPLADSELPRWQRRSLLVPPAVTVTLGTLFNHLPEAYWLRYTQATGFRLTAIVSGGGEIQLLRQNRSGEEQLLACRSFDTTASGAEAAVVELTAPAPTDRVRGAGVLFVRLVATDQAAVLGEAEWSALDVQPAPVRLVAGYCTFHREVQLLGNVQAILADPEVCQDLEALVIVDQGGSDSLATAMECLSRNGGGEIIHLVRQGNFGGSGGFARVMTEALAMDQATHVLLMDDDARVETESIFRAQRFLALSDNVALGGQMLDLCLPTVLLENGARVMAENLGLDLIDIFTMAHQPDALRKFAQVNRIDYNAWWFFAVPLAIVRNLGLPMPMFIRGDDIEYGLRLKAGGVATVTLPGVALWHEPFYLKRGWQSYYDIRNMFVLGSIRLGLSGAKAAGIFLRKALQALFGHDYAFAALRCQGVEDWLKGPEVLEDDPRPRHEAVKALLARYDVASVPSSQTVEDTALAVEAAPRGLAGIGRMLGVLVRNLLGRETPAADGQIPWIPGELESWWILARYDDVALRPLSIIRMVDQDGDWRRLRRSPRAFRSLFGKTLLLSLKLVFKGSRVAAQWRDAAPGLCSGSAWNRLLAGPAPVAARMEDPGFVPGPATLKEA